MKLSFRYFSNVVNVNKLKRSVLISQSNDIYTNLALEDWIYRKYDFENHNILMLWSNDPCVVIGRYQNPWLEANVTDLPYVTAAGVKLARRNSGGGTVYHDRGNLNLTFFTSKKQYDRKLNLQLIKAAIYKEYGLKVDVSPRDDLVIDDLKVSGTAAKLGRLSAYHHCTLLVNANKTNISRALQKECSDIKTTASRSVRSKVVNLCDENPLITVGGLISAIGREFLQQDTDDEFQYLNPTNAAFPELDKIRTVLSEWNWCFGKTPKFIVTKSFIIPSKFLVNERDQELGIIITVENGKISDVTLNDLTGLFSLEAVMINKLRDCRFTPETIDGLIQSLLEEKYKFVSDCVRQVMTSI
ncbi:hypothetical protein RI129_012647 [Pyrocoelia pectoralis]|uniref:BPL/LPL catalytic domain-containing protein n=1 Tax=Pyrocoelia pectoralis TaxID=417401 RepID=A0AAN7UYK4_9COLE